MSKEQLEYTGTSYKCNNCPHKWNYNDTHCPECGSQDFVEDEIKLGLGKEQLTLEEERRQLLSDYLIKLDAITPKYWTPELVKQKPGTYVKEEQPKENHLELKELPSLDLKPPKEKECLNCSCTRIEKYYPYCSARCQSYWGE